MIVVTGAAGFIGYHVTQRLLARGDEVLGIDNLNDYYDPSLKFARLGRLNDSRFEFVKLDVADTEGMRRLFAERKPQRVIHLAAQAGVRYSLTNPYAYTESNIHGFLNILEGCRHNGVEHLVYASSSSVYGANTHQPFSEHDNVDHPVSLYAATKKANELMAHTYAHLFGLPTTGLRFFTVYGPWGRPDMALFKFTRLIVAGEPIPVYNEGRMSRDFTYIDDIVEGIVRVMAQPPAPGASAAEGTEAPYRIFNIGNPANCASIRELAQLMIETASEFPELRDRDQYATGKELTDDRAADAAVAGKGQAGDLFCGTKSGPDEKDAGEDVRGGRAVHGCAACSI